jgi:hypothetical protein
MEVSKTINPLRKQPDLLDLLMRVTPSLPQRGRHSKGWIPLIPCIISRVSYDFFRSLKGLWVVLRTIEWSKIKKYL